MATNEKRLAQRLGASIRRFRQAHGWSQAELAEKAEVSTDYVSLLERGQRLPSLDVTVELAALFGIGVDELIATSKEHDAWVTEATALLAHVPMRIRAAVLAMLRAAVRE